jgi:hypothetical protein
VRASRSSFNPAHPAKLVSAVAIAASLLLASCNLFDPFDSPTGDAQLLSAGKAAMDNGDFATALELFGKMSSGNEQGAANEAFAILAQNGVGMGDFMSAFGVKEVAPGKAITTLAGHIASSGSAGADKRNAMFGAFLKINEITNTAELRGLVRFITATVLAAELLAEDAGSDNAFDPDDLAAGATVCKGLANGICANPSCNAPGGKALVDGAFTPANLDATATTLAISITSVYQAINEIQTGLNEIGASGNLGGASLTFADSIIALGVAPQCFRAQLLAQQIGVHQ